MKLKLEVRQQRASDIYRDMVRIHISDRGGNIKEGEIYKLKCNGKKRLVVVRGLSGDSSGIIRVDEVIRSALKIEPKSTYDFELVKPVPFFGDVMWSLNAAEPTVRVASFIAFISLIISLIAFPWHDVAYFLERAFEFFCTQFANMKK